MLKTMENLCSIDGRVVTEGTRFMLQAMRKSKTIEEAMSKIVRNVAFINGLI